MIEQTKKFLTNYAFVVVMTLYVVGFLINNIYLSKFNIVEYDLLQTKYILTGAMFIFFSSIIFSLLILRLDFIKISNNFSFINFTHYITRFFLLAFLIFAFFSKQAKLDVFETRLLWIMLGPACMYFFIIVARAFPGHDFSDIPLLKYTYEYFFSIFLIPSAATYIYFLGNNAVFYSIHLFLWWIFIAIFVNLCAMSDRERGISNESAPIKTIEENHILNKFLLLLRLFLLPLLLIRTYSNSFYPLLSNNWGGGKPVSATILYEKEEIKGSILGDSSQWIYLNIDSNNTSILIKKESVKKIIFEK